MNRLEQNLQIQVWQFLQVALNHKNSFAWATVNESGFGGKKAIILGSIRKKCGVVAGIPDLFVFSKGQLIGLELKTIVGTQSDSQKVIEKRIEASGGTYHLVRSVQEAEEALRADGVDLKVRSLM
tara:strand:- start:237 stop:611 length:375 start_codon:yes stop_codon:yes gene_type:complete